MTSSLTAIVSLSLIILSCGDDRRCTGINACNEFDKNSQTKLITPLYWYDVSVEKCVLLRPDCTKPNINVTFTSVGVCEDICAVTVEPDESEPVAIDCQTKNGNCNEDLAPTSQSSHTVSFVVSVSCTIGVIALVVVIVLTMYAMRRQNQALRKKYLENMLNQFSEPNQYDSSDDSFDDNPEENNLFDRLEQQW